MDYRYDTPQYQWEQMISRITDAAESVASAYECLIKAMSYGASKYDDNNQSAFIKSSITDSMDALYDVIRAASIFSRAMADKEEANLETNVIVETKDTVLL